MTCITCSLKCGALLEKEILGLDRRQNAAIVKGGHLTVLGSHLVVILSYRKLRGFLHLWFPLLKIFVSLVSCDVLM